MKLLAATRSAGKQREFRRVLEPAGFEVVFPDDIGLYPTPAEDLLELGETFEANARRKAEHFARLSGLPTVADDSGLEVLSLGGAPGVRSRRWAGATGSDAQVDAANNAELVRRLSGATGARRGARYRCVLVYFASPERFPALRGLLCRPDSGRAERGGGIRLRSLFPERRAGQDLRRGLAGGEGRSEPPRAGAPRARRGLASSPLSS